MGPTDEEGVTMPTEEQPQVDPREGPLWCRSCDSKVDPVSLLCRCNNR